MHGRLSLTDISPPPLSLKVKHLDLLFSALGLAPRYDTVFLVRTKDLGQRTPLDIVVTDISQATKSRNDILAWILLSNLMDPS